MCLCVCYFVKEFTDWPCELRLSCHFLVECVPSFLCICVFLLFFLFNLLHNVLFLKSKIVYIALITVQGCLRVRLTLLHLTKKDS